MKMKLFLLLLALTSLMMSSLAFAQTYPEGMIAYWKFEEGGGTTAFDSVGTYDGTIHDAVYTTGQVGGALSFDGYYDHVVLPTEAAHIQLQMTWEFLMMGTVTPTYKYNFAWYSRIVYPEGCYDQSYWTFDTPDRPVPYSFRFGIANPDGPRSCLVAGSTLQDGIWHHIVAVRDNTNVKFYVDNVLTAEVDNPALDDWTPLSSDHYLGRCDNPLPIRSFNGLLDEVAIYHRVLTPDEIEEHYLNIQEGRGYELPIVNHPPVACMECPEAVNEETEVTLDGSCSWDEDEDDLSYNWAQVAGTPVELQGADTATPSFNAPVVGWIGETLTFELVVNDGQENSVAESCSVLVENVNHPPEAVCPQAMTRDELDTVELDGSESQDPDNDPLTYQWVQVNGTAVTLSDPEIPSPFFTAPYINPGGETLEFQLTVSDGYLSDACTVTVFIRNINDPPSCELALADPAIIWPPNHKMVEVGIVNVADPDDDSVSITVTGVTQDEPVNGLGDGDTSPDAVLQGETVLLRAERSGIGNGRVYVIAFSADDGFNLPCTGTVTVCVPHSRRSGCEDDGQVFDSTLP